MQMIINLTLSLIIFIVLMIYHKVTFRNLEKKIREDLIGLEKKVGEER